MNGTNQERVYFNEVDPVACAVLRETQSGFVDERSIKEVMQDDVKGYQRAHFFAGAGLWEVAARMANWPSGRSIWTGSCPCQPFSVAGKGHGAQDERHLWPDFFRLIDSCRPGVVVGEQVGGKAGYGWLDGVRADLEGIGYSCRAVDIPACAVGAPQRRNRIYWVALADAHSGGRDGRAQDALGSEIGRDAAEGAAVGDLGDSYAEGRLQSQGSVRTVGGWGGDANARGYWSDAEWLQCADGKARRAKPGIRLLVDGLAGRTDIWRLAGNSIVPQVAAQVLAAFLEAEAEGFELRGAA